MSSAATQVDLLVIGGGPAGLAAAHMFARVKRPCLVYDSGLYRNANVEVAHTIAGFEAANPAVFRNTMREQLLESYDWTEYRKGKIVQLEKVEGGGFAAKDEEGREIKTRKVVMATGIKDHLPAIPGLAEQWGKRVFHCIFCHGTETAEKPFAYLFTPNNARMNPNLTSMTLKMWPTLKHKPAYILTHGMDVETEQGRRDAGSEKLWDVAQKKGYQFISSPIESVVADASGLTINFTSHPPISVPHMLLFPEKLTPTDHALPLLSEAFLGARLGFMGNIPAAQVKAEGTATGGMPMRMGDDPTTDVKGLFWAGNSGSAMANVGLAVAQGQMAGVAAAHELGEDDLQKA